MNIGQHQYLMNHTIYAPSTIIGKSAISVIRISGIEALKVLEKFEIKEKLNPRYAYFRTLKINGEIIDHCLIFYLKNPHSFTGEDTIELQLHGSKAIINLVLNALSEIPNFVIAEPGEFSRRAFLNGKLDLIQAEGLLSVIHAETQEQLKQANKELSGEISKIFDSIRYKILQIFANCEALMDFPEDDIDINLTASVYNKLNEIKAEIGAYLNDNSIGEKIKDGFKIAIIGKPNVGKSSLINYLAKKPIAIVSDIAGTTRDLVTIDLNIGGYEVQLIDTAGIRETNDVVESIGVSRAIEAHKNADLVIILCVKEDLCYQELIDDFDKEKHILVINKEDTIANQKDDWLSVSIINDIGLDNLIARIRESISNLFPSFSPIISNKRQRSLLQNLYNELIKIIDNFYLYPFLDILTEEIRMLANYISQLTGNIATEEILDELFYNFCIGK